MQAALLLHTLCSDQLRMSYVYFWPVLSLAMVNYVIYCTYLWSSSIIITIIIINKDIWKTRKDPLINTHPLSFSHTHADAHIHRVSDCGLPVGTFRTSVENYCSFSTRCKCGMKAPSAGGSWINMYQTMKSLQKRGYMNKPSRWFFFFCFAFFFASDLW